MILHPIDRAMVAGLAGMSAIGNIADVPHGLSLDDGRRRHRNPCGDAPHIPEGHKVAKRRAKNKAARKARARNRG